MIKEELTDINFYTFKKINKDGKELYEIVFKGYIAEICMKEKEKTVGDKYHIGTINNEIILHLDIEEEKILIDKNQLVLPIVAKFNTGRRLYIHFNYLLYKGNFVSMLIDKIQNNTNTDNKVIIFESVKREEEFYKDINELINDLENFNEQNMIDYYLEKGEFEKIKEILNTQNRCNL